MSARIIFVGKVVMQLNYPESDSDSYDITVESMVSLFQLVSRENAKAHGLHHMRGGCQSADYYLFGSCINDDTS